MRQMLTNQPKKIGHMEFGLLSPKEVRGLSATKVITADTYDDDGFPIEMGLMDPRLGVIEPGLRCKTCGQRVGDCPGHFGHIDLAMPVIHVGFVKTIRNCLRATCRQCGRIPLLDKELRTQPTQFGVGTCDRESRMRQRPAQFNFVQPSQCRDRNRRLRMSHQALQDFDGRRIAVPR